MSSAGLALEKGLPCNLDAERFVLGSILMDDSQFVQVAGALEAGDFSLEKASPHLPADGENSASVASASTASPLPTSFSATTNSNPATA